MHAHGLGRARPAHVRSSMPAAGYSFTAGSGPVHACMQMLRRCNQLVRFEMCTPELDQWVESQTREREREKHYIMPANKAD